MSEPSAQQQRIVLLAIMASTFFMPILACAMVFGGVVPEGGSLGEEGVSPNLLGVAFLVAGVLSVIVSFVLRGLLVAQGNPAFAATMVAMAMCEAPSIMGFVHTFLTGMFPFAIVLWVFAIVGAGMHFVSFSIR